MSRVSCVSMCCLSYLGPWFEPPRPRCPPVVTAYILWSTGFGCSLCRCHPLIYTFLLFIVSVSSFDLHVFCCSLCRCHPLIYTFLLFIVSVSSFDLHVFCCSLCRRHPLIYRLWLLFASVYILWSTGFCCPLCRCHSLIYKSCQSLCRCHSLVTCFRCWLYRRTSFDLHLFHAHCVCIIIWSHALVAHCVGVI